MSFERITESNSNYDDLELNSSLELLEIINKEDKSIAYNVQKELKKINNLILKVIEQISNGGRLFYIGSGTSGRLGVVDASECPPTFGVENTLVNGIIAGGDKAIRKSIENAEDEPMKGWEDLLEHNINKKDIVIGIAASGTTPYVLGAISNCNKNNIPSGCITCNPGSPLSLACEYPIEINV
ncbi:MAG: N-acetylmuramic acid 6-phosphate etherase, partial [Flavobacteriaceae bacterium]|nr:N-acetylmuramic acid 6-phosphate etherase [Flavobacteriaceae bacterium]